MIENEICQIIVVCLRTAVGLCFCVFININVQRVIDGTGYSITRGEDDYAAQDSEYKQSGAPAIASEDGSRVHCHTPTKTCALLRTKTSTQYNAGAYTPQARDNGRARAVVPPEFMYSELKTGVVAMK